MSYRTKNGKNGQTQANAGARSSQAKPPGNSGLPRLEAANLAGLTQLMNPQNLRTDVDLDAAEKNVMGRTGLSAPSKRVLSDPLKLYQQELNSLAAELGIDFQDGDGDLDESEDIPPAKPQISQPPVKNLLGAASIDSLLADLDLGSNSASSSSDSSSEESSDASDSSSSPDDARSDSSSGASSSGSSSESEDEGSSESSVDDASVISNLEKELGIDLASARRQGKRRRKVHNVPVASKHEHSRLADLTEEQERRRHLNAVLGDMRKDTKTSFSVEHERMQDAKASKLEQIGQLRMTLEEEGVDCSGVGAPKMTSPMEEIESVLAILKLKNDRNRYATLAEEVILGIAEGIETVLDGTRELPLVGWKPDYTGYHNTVNVKLHRMRFETSQVVGNVIQKYSIGPTTRVLMEILPSFLLYPRQQRKQRGTPGLHADFAGSPHVADARSAYSAIRRADTADSLSAISDI